MLAWLADFSGVKLDVGDLMLKLVLRVLLPLIVGKLCQMIPGVPPRVKKHKWQLKLVSIYALVALPWILTSRAMDANKFDGVGVAPPPPPPHTHTRTPSITCLLGSYAVIYFATCFSSLLSRRS
jgi:predicted Na+-dependent transporter